MGCYGIELLWHWVVMALVCAYQVGDTEDGEVALLMFPDEGVDLEIVSMHVLFDLEIQRLLR